MSKYVRSIQIMTDLSRLLWLIKTSKKNWKEVKEGNDKTSKEILTFIKQWKETSTSRGNLLINLTIEALAKGKSEFCLL
jgi:hypothetical protein